MQGLFALGGYVPDVLGTQEPVGQLPLKAFRDLKGDSDSHWMREVLRVSMEGCGEASPNPSVGCVLVKNGLEIARGCTQAFGGLHGERVAFERAPLDISWPEVTAYVALEPCAHHGKQPPCVDLILEKKPGRVVVALGDPFEGVNGAGFSALRAAGLRLEMGPLARETALWLSPFLLSVKQKRVVLAAKWAQSMDGCLADDSGASRWITGPEARRYTHWLRRKYDAILVGAGTLLADAPRLDARVGEMPALQQPLRMVFDPNARLLLCDENTRLRLRAGTLAFGAPLVLFCTQTALGAALREPGVSHWFEELGRLGVTFEVLDAPIGYANAIQSLLAKLNGFDFSPYRKGKFLPRPVQSVLVEGGATFLNALFAARAIDICHAFVAPFFMGGTAHRLGEATVLSDVERFSPVASFQAGSDFVSEFLPSDRHALLASCWNQ
jgi:diaminohydroxyphosphoribosylaminopyrimidine deaminase / 5-amino-6-(5-phosphoribosylamino)uracil reductase